MKTCTPREACSGVKSSGEVGSSVALPIADETKDTLPPDPCNTLTVELGWEPSAARSGVLKKAYLVRVTFSAM